MLSKLIPKTLFLKIANTFWLLLLTVALAQYLLLTHYWNQAYNLIVQRLNWGVASSIAADLERSANNGVISFVDLRKEFNRLEELNPGIDIYLLDNEGFVEWSSADDSPNFSIGYKGVPLEIIDRYFTDTSFYSEPVVGPVPGTNSESVFSAARVNLNGGDKIVYVVLFGMRYRSIIDNVEAIYFGIGGSIVLTLLLLFTASMGFSAFFIITKRFRSVVNAVHSFAGGDMDARVAVVGEDELAQLSREINSMADTAVSSLQEVKEMDSLRRRMVAMVSHDLGGPLRATQAGIRSCLRELDADSNNDLRDNLTKVSKNIDALVQHVNELFNLSKIETRELLPEFESFSLLDVVTEEIVPRFSPLAEEAGITLISEYDEELAYHVFADLEMIERVLGNLVENAIRYSSSGDRVSISLKVVDDQVEVGVEDTGAGMDSDELDSIFDPFVRGSAGKLNHESSGLGLAIVKQLLAVHEQEVIVQSRKGEGTKFSFRLPSPTQL